MLLTCDGAAVSSRLDSYATNPLFRFNYPLHFVSEDGRILDRRSCDEDDEVDACHTGNPPRELFIITWGNRPPACGLPDTRKRVAYVPLPPEDPSRILTSLDGHSEINNNKLNLRVFNRGEADQCVIVESSGSIWDLGIIRAKKLLQITIQFWTTPGPGYTTENRCWYTTEVELTLLRWYTVRQIPHLDSDTMTFRFEEDRRAITTRTGPGQYVFRSLRLPSNVTRYSDGGGHVLRHQKLTVVVDPSRRWAVFPALPGAETNPDLLPIVLNMVVDRDTTNNGTYANSLTYAVWGADLRHEYIELDPMLHYDGRPLVCFDDSGACPYNYWVTPYSKDRLYRRIEKMPPVFEMVGGVLRTRSDATFMDVLKHCASPPTNQPVWVARRRSNCLIEINVEFAHWFTLLFLVAHEYEVFLDVNEVRNTATNDIVVRILPTECCTRNVSGGEYCLSFWHPDLKHMASYHVPPRNDEYFELSPSTRRRVDLSGSLVTIHAEHFRNASETGSAPRLAFMGRRRDYVPIIIRLNVTTYPFPDLWASIRDGWANEPLTRPSPRPIAVIDNRLVHLKHVCYLGVFPFLLTSLTMVYFILSRRRIRLAREKRR